MFRLGNGVSLVPNGAQTSEYNVSFPNFPQSVGAGAFNLYTSTAASTAVSNTSTETLADVSYTLPASFLQAGDRLHIFGQGIAPNTNSTDTLTTKLYIGGLAGTAINQTAALDATDNDIFILDTWVIFRTVGASGTLIASGLNMFGVAGTTTARGHYVASTAVNTTTTQVIGVGLKWSAASASDNARLDMLFVDLFRKA